MFRRRFFHGQSDGDQPVQFEEVLDKELEYFRKKKRLKRKSGHASRAEVTEHECGGAYASEIVSDANKARLTGLAFSGGGIRSATFNLGVLQGLARLKLLDQFDYLSTVSGGGYIGSWFTAWTKRVDRILEKNNSRTAQSGGGDDQAGDGLKQVAQELASSVSAYEDETLRGTMQPDPAPIWHLREYSNYLSPRWGLWSTDTWTLGVTYVRNLVLNFSLLLVTLTTLVLGTRAIAALYFKAAHGQYEIAYVLAPVLFCVLLFTASLAGSIELCSHLSNNRKGPAVSYIAVTTSWLAAAVGSLLLWHTMAQPGMFTITLANLIPWNFPLALVEPFPGNFILALAAFPIVISPIMGWFIGRISCIRKARATQKNDVPESMETSKSRVEFWLVGGAQVASVVTLFTLLWLLGFWMRDDWLGADMQFWDPQLWRIVVWGTPLLVLIFSIAAVVFVGLAGGALSELEREWLGRFFAVLFKWTALTTFLVVLVVYSDCWVEWLGNNYFGGLINLGVGAAAWGALSAAGAYLARNAMISKPTGLGRLKKVVLAFAPFVFILGMLILTVWATDQLVYWIVQRWDLVASVNGDPPGFWYLMASVDVSMLLLILAGNAFLVLVWSWRVGVNRFSLHSLYGYRLIRAYLGASSLERKAHPFTAFDDRDNEVHLPDLARGKGGYSGPYPIINAAINLVSSQRLAWQKRKAASFTFTPLFCGYEFCGEANDNNARRTARVGGFVKSDCYAGSKGKGLSLGKAMTISGAAASPNMGYHSSPALTFLMTTFNVRLGWWLPNTAINDPILLAKRDPGWGLLYLLNELLGLTDARSDYVYLSDGGHFENLGIYELVRRRCRIIIACDAEADPGMTFTGLGNAIEKCQTDLGVPIDIDVSQIKPDAATGHSLWHCAVGWIRYSAADREQPDGTLVYIKASLTGDEPQNVATYADDHAYFPHETTADQWFDESQFESYRTLGEYIVENVLKNAVHVTDSVRRDTRERRIERVILEARKQWYPGSGVNTAKPADHDALLEAIMDTLRNDTRLTFLDEQLYPNLSKVAHEFLQKRQDHSIPESYSQFRAGFYFCKRLIQFMQQVYYDRQLDLEYAAPRNRGWMNLFRRWSWARMLRFTWTMTAGTYGARFQSFCEHRLGLESGEPKFDAEPLEIIARLVPGKAQYESDPVAPDGTLKGWQYDWEAVKSDSGLNEYETLIIREFIDAYVQQRDPNTRPQSFRFQVFTLNVATDNPVAKERDVDMTLNAGFVIASSAPCAKAILYFRIRPSMRNMDLARKAFLERCTHPVLAKYPINLVDKLPKIEKETKTARQRRAFREVHNMERESLDRCRWFSELFEEIGQNEYAENGSTRPPATGEFLV